MVQALVPIAVEILIVGGMVLFIAMKPQIDEKIRELGGNRVRYVDYRDILYHKYEKVIVIENNGDIFVFYQNIAILTILKAYIWMMRKLDQKNGNSEKDIDDFHDTVKGESKEVSAYEIYSLQAKTAGSPTPPKKDDDDDKKKDQKSDQDIKKGKPDKNSHIENGLEIEQKVQSQLGTYRTFPKTYGNMGKGKIWPFF